MICEAGLRLELSGRCEDGDWTTDGLEFEMLGVYGAGVGTTEAQGWEQRPPANNTILLNKPPLARVIDKQC